MSIKTLEAIPVDYALRRPLIEILGGSQRHNDFCGLLDMSPVERWVKRMPFMIVAIAVGFYLAMVLFMYLAQSRFVYIPSKNVEASPTQIGLQFEDVYLETEDGVTLHAWHVRADSAAPTLLFCHGNAGNISHRLESIQIFHNLGLNVFVFDYRGYGKSEGQPDEEGTYRDAEAAWKFLTATIKIAPEKIIVFGRSLGGAVAVDLASRRRPGLLIVESSFTSANDIAVKQFPFLPVRWLSRFDYNSLEKIGGVTCPVLIIHSRQDELVPFSHGERLFAAAPSPKQFFEITGFHNDGYLITGSAYEERLQQFIASHLHS